MSIFVGEGMSEMLEIGFLLVFPWFLHGNPMGFPTKSPSFPKARAESSPLDIPETLDAIGICQKHAFPIPISANIIVQYH